MALLKTKEIRAMRTEELDTKMKELNDELMHERGVAAMGGAPASPGKLRALRTNMARILTIKRERELEGRKPAEAPAGTKKAAAREKASLRGGEEREESRRKPEKEKDESGKLKEEKK